VPAWSSPTLLAASVHKRPVAAAVSFSAHVDFVGDDAHARLSKA